MCGDSSHWQLSVGKRSESQIPFLENNGYHGSSHRERTKRTGSKLADESAQSCRSHAHWELVLQSTCQDQQTESVPRECHLLQSSQQTSRVGRSLSSSLGNARWHLKCLALKHPRLLFVIAPGNLILLFWIYKVTSTTNQAEFTLGVL